MDSDTNGANKQHMQSQLLILNTSKASDLQISGSNLKVWGGTGIYISLLPKESMDLSNLLLEIWRFPTALTKVGDTPFLLSLLLQNFGHSSTPLPVQPPPPIKGLQKRGRSIHLNMISNNDLKYGAPHISVSK